MADFRMKQTNKQTTTTTIQTVSWARESKEASVKRYLFTLPDIK